MTGTLVATSGQVGSTAISASEDSAAKRAVAIVGDSNGDTHGTPRQALKSAGSFAGQSSWSGGTGSPTLWVPVGEAGKPRC